MKRLLHPCLAALALAGCAEHRIEWHYLLRDDLVRSTCRITSYNVCYTKLLRLRVDRAY